MLINHAYLIIDHEGGEKHTQCEDFDVIVLALVHASQSLSVHNVNIENLIVLLDGDWLRVEPQTSCASVNRRVYCEGSLFSDKLIHKKGLSSSVAACDTDYGYLVMRSFEYLQSFLANLEVTLIVNVYELDSSLVKLSGTEVACCAV